MTQTYASKATVGHSNVAVLDHTYADPQPKMADKPTYLTLTYDTDDRRQQRALQVAWKSRGTQVIRMNPDLKDNHMADIVQACMCAAFEGYTLKDCDAVWFKSEKQEDGTYAKVERAGIRDMSEEQRVDLYNYKHIQRACMRAVKRVLDLHSTQVQMPESEEELDRMTPARRVTDAYMPTGEASEWDRLDALLGACSKRLHPSQAQALRRLLAGETTLSQVSSRSREAIRLAVLETLHMTRA